MTALYLDGFEHYGAGTAVSRPNMLAGAWAEVSGNGGCDTPPWGSRTGSLALVSNNGFVAGRFVLPATKTRIFQSFGFAVTNLPGGNSQNQICSFRNGANGDIANLWLTSTGAITLTDASNNVLGSTQGPVVVARNWHFLEMDFNIAGQAFVLRVDDPSASLSPAISLSSLSLSGPLAQLAFLNAPNGAAVQSWMDDLFIRDSSGSVNNGFLGDRRVATMLSNADTATVGWTPNYYKKLGAGILNIPVPDQFGDVSGVWALTNTSQNIGNGDFTIESFVRFSSLPTASNKAVIFGKYDETHNQRSYQLFLGSQALNGGSLCFQTSTDGTISTVAQPIVFPFTPNLNQWYHMAVVRSSGQDFLYVDGQQQGLAVADTNTYFAGTARFGLGGQPDASGAPVLGGTGMIGWMDEFRLTVGFARYTANFTPTTVEFPRGSPADPQWTNVALLLGFDSLIQDESLHAATMGAQNAVQQTVNDGPLVGVFSTIGKAVPDDSTFIAAPFLPATGTLTCTTNFANNETVTVGTKATSTPAVYTFKTTLTGAAFEVLIDTSTQNSLQNLFNAINAGAGAGTKYGTGTTANLDVIASQLPAGLMLVTALTAGTAGNSIASTETGAHSSWGGSTLSGGTAIPGPSNFKIQRPPPRTTLISAVQITLRASKSDAGLGSINTALVGALGGVTAGSTHNLTVNPNYYRDIYEIDPDSSGPISPATLINGAIQINRDT